MKEVNAARDFHKGFRSKVERRRKGCVKLGAEIPMKSYAEKCPSTARGDRGVVFGTGWKVFVG
jgi:hypothetical protein